MADIAEEAGVGRHGGRCCRDMYLPVELGTTKAAYRQSPASNSNAHAAMLCASVMSPPRIIRSS